MKFHKLLINKKYKNFEELEKEISKISNNKEKGDIFEQFVKVYLLLHKQYYQLEEAYLFNELPYHLKKFLQLEKKDYGVDGVMILKEEKVACFQAKFRSGRETPPFNELSTFVSESFRSDYKYIITNAYEIPSAVKKHKDIIEILVDTLEGLDELFFENLYNFCNSQKLLVKKLSPFPHQKRAIEYIIEGFKTEDRGKYISACGSGKTLTAFWTMERLNAQNVLFIVPSLALIKQTLESWSNQTEKGFNYLCVCSDNTVSKDLEVDDDDITVSEIGVPVTTNPERIFDFISKKANIPKIIFSTYQSLDVLSDSLKIKKNDFSFDITFFDEAHRTAGIKKSLFNIAIDDDKIRSKKRLFMTATEKMLTPRMKKRLEMETIFSMDDKEKYGEVFERLTFGEAIDLGIISDYKIVIAAITEKEGYSLIEKNRYIKISKNGIEKETTAKNLFKQLLLTRCIEEYDLKKIITFHSSIRNSKSFISDNKSTVNLRQIIESNLRNKKGLFVKHIDGAMSTGERTKIFDSFKKHYIGIVSNVRCLTEGVDIPIIDAVYFVNPKNSLVDIVQASGRALRKDEGNKKIAYIIIPVILPPTDKEIFNEEEFGYLFYIVQALRDQDNRLEEYIDRLNLHMSEGGTIKNFSQDKFSPLVFNLSKEIDLDEFSNMISLKIAEKNANPTIFDTVTKKYGKLELKSGYERKFKTIGDYQTPGYKNIVEKTIRKFNNENEKLNKKSLIIDHNNISHTYRLGLLLEQDGKFSLSDTGKKLYRRDITFEHVFLKTMLKKDDINFYPYITTLKILLKVGGINFIQFLYGLYTIRNNSEQEIENTIKKINELKKYNYNLIIAKEKNRRILLGLLNKQYGVNFSEPDLLMKTTAGNQFKYLKGHLSLLKDIINDKSQEIKVKNFRGLSELLKLIKS